MMRISKRIDPAISYHFLMRPVRGEREFRGIFANKIPWQMGAEGKSEGAADDGLEIKQLFWSASSAD
jgi:hypothetical protein